MIPYGRQEITPSDIEAVVDVLKSDFLTQGPAVPKFEKAVASYCGAMYGIAVNSGTSALHIACMALGVGKNDLVWTSPVTFVASANCARFCGADIDFVDIDPKTYNMSVSALESKLKVAAACNCLPKVVIPVHLSGQSCDMLSIRRLADQYGFAIIEDACHALGARFREEKIGSCKYSDITVFSFHPVKIITTAEGGMALTNQKELAEKMDLYRTHAITKDPARMTHVPDGPWYYQQLDLGYNYRMTEIQAALGVSQLTRLDEVVEKRHVLADRYNSSLDNLPLTLPYQDANNYSAYHLYIIRLNLEKISFTHKQVFEELHSDGVGVNLHYIPVYRQPYYSILGFKSEDFPESEKYYQEAISIPLYHHLSKEDQDRVITSLRRILK
ncbi:UDP-4-keto-6-deoxy-N-acetylglucosamine 4-aminotransferase [Desulfocapsa sulfexigens DSM 10523]|uniref:UDP-4-keto-6-deoxy-N-acetylglucosamine 4-aminotransferase n=1 Tax=Desulfocapsa sulfexigens (strain DSM 10523 / SB164P1) TaxID=1167006 RepID=M1NH65_DESSD|nr:UDP-4-amino-4,6-dideoxy-N-acetyl-beta-L-altrosamine transaminase [Desulfocapsa sulfexigens]AGF78954.1 UDP-4-keto-6-deoxy-N-acetylglucosamine 4-aminotransferase [Desulfocapsa sulfexigens DSM 10523]